jgi:hypothetical protein
MLETNAPFGEIIESSLKTIKVLCWDAQKLPRFGSIVSCSFNAITAYGVITEMVTESVDAQRTPFAFKKTDAELRREQPQIFSFIQTICTIVIVWHEKAETKLKFNTLSIPTPAPLHTWAHTTDTNLLRLVITNRFLLDALSDRISPEAIDDCIIALVTEAALNNSLSKTELVTFIESYSQELNHSLKRAQRFLQHMEMLL